MSKNVDPQRHTWRRLWSSFIRGKRINVVSREAEMYFWRIYAAIDDYGNIEAEPNFLHAATAGRRDMSLDEIVDWVNELASVGLLSLYELHGDDFLHVHNFVEWQPAGRNGKRIRRVPASPWDADESANDYMRLSQQMSLRPQGESRYFLNSPANNASDDSSDDYMTENKGDRMNNDNRGNPNESQRILTNPNDPVVLPRDSRVSRGNKTQEKEKEKHVKENESLSSHSVKGLEKGVFVVEVYEYWKYRMGTPRSQLSPERQRKIIDRWFDSSLEEVKQAIDGCEADDFHMARGQHTNGNPHNDIKLICRDRAKVEDLMGRVRRRTVTREDKKAKQEEAKRRWSQK